MTSSKYCAIWQGQIGGFMGKRRRRKSVRRVQPRGLVRDPGRAYKVSSLHPTYKRRLQLALERIKPLQEVEDLRDFHPRGKYRDYRTLEGTSAEYITQSTDRRKFGRVGQTYFRDPVNVALCKRRRKRRETLFAQRKIGKGMRVTKRRRYTEKSKVRC